MEIMGCEVIELVCLKGMTTAIKQGDKLYVWPGFQPQLEFKYMEIPTLDEYLNKLRDDRDKAENERLVGSMASRRFEYFFNPLTIIVP